MAENGAKIRLDLWAILSFLVLLVGICLGYLFLAQAADREKQVTQDQKVIVLQEQYRNINDKLDKLVMATEAIKDAFTDHRIKTEQKDRKTAKGND